jgi:hypothetical protein
MPGQIDKVNINGNLFDFGSQELTFDNNIITGYTSITYGGEKRARTKGYGAGRARKPRGRTSGKYTPPDIKIKFYLDSWAKVMAWAAARSPDGKSYGDAEFPAMLQYVEPGLDTHVVKFERMAIVEVGGDGEDADDPNMIEIGLDVMSCERDGLTLYNSSQG